jgi:hydrogenase maturation protease
VILVDAAPRGEPAGTLTLLEPDQAWTGRPSVEPHRMDPVAVLRLARELGPVSARILVVCCEPARVPVGTPDEDVLVGLSEPVRAALDDAVRMVESVVAELTDAGSGPSLPDGNIEVAGEDQGGSRE